MSNMKLWDSVEKTDPKFTKKFRKEGGFAGTAIGATYIVKKATEQFGSVGIGWGYDIVKEEYLDGSFINERDRIVIHKALIKVWYISEGVKGEVSHYGQTTFIGANKNGTFTDEEHAKKTVTDGLTKCLSMLGFSADIHLGFFDDGKYVSSMGEYFKDKPVQETLSEAEIKDIESRVALAGVSMDKVLLFVFGEYRQGKTVKDIPKSYFLRCVNKLNASIPSKTTTDKGDKK